MARKHDFDAAWKSILEAFEIEVVELLFPEIFDEIAWELGTESLDLELQEIQKEIFDKDSTEKIISDKIIKVRLKNQNSKILFIHVEVQEQVRQQSFLTRVTVTTREKSKKEKMSNSKFGHAASTNGVENCKNLLNKTQH